MRSKHRKALARGLGNAEVIKRVLEECMQERLDRLPEWFALAEKLLDNEHGKGWARAHPTELAARAQDLLYDDYNADTEGEMEKLLGLPKGTIEANAKALMAEAREKRS